MSNGRRDTAGVQFNTWMTRCCKCNSKTETAEDVQHCKICGTKLCRDCVRLPYTDPEVDRRDWECCECNRITEAYSIFGQDVKYCRFCGAEICDDCESTSLRFEDEKFSTSATSGIDEMARSSTEPRGQRLPSPEENVDLDREGIFHMEMNENEVDQQQGTDGSTGRENKQISEQFKGVHPLLSGRKSDKSKFQQQVENLQINRVL